MTFGGDGHQSFKKHIKAFEFWNRIIIHWLLLIGEMPTGASVQSGDVSISGINKDHLIIDQSTNKSIINWNSFSIHKKGQVDFNMPSSSSSR